MWFYFKVPLGNIPNKHLMFTTWKCVKATFLVTFSLNWVNELPTSLLLLTWGGGTSTCPGGSWNSSLPCGLSRSLELTLIHSNLAEEMRETISLYAKLLSLLHFICPSVPNALAHHACAIEVGLGGFSGIVHLVLQDLHCWDLHHRLTTWHINYLHDYHISNLAC